MKINPYHLDSITNTDQMHVKLLHQSLRHDLYDVCGTQPCENWSESIIRMAVLKGDF